MKKTAFLLTILLLFASVLSACGGNKTDGEKAANGGTGKPEKGGTLIFGRGADAVSLDPINVTDGESIRVTYNIFETLFEYDADLNIKPRLATSYETSEDGLTWTIHLRKGVKFHDGTDFNADAVVFNFERWMDPNNPYHDGDFTYYTFLYGGFKGDENHKIVHVKALDDYTVEIRLKEKIAPFLSYLAIPMFGISSPEAIKKYDDKYGEHPVGTGPFKFESWDRNDKIVLTKNENYYEEGKPYLDQLIFRVIPDNSARLSALKSGDIDIMDGLNPDDKNAAESDQNLDFVKRPSFNISYLAFNTEKAPFNDVKVRQAINMAINKQGIIDAFFNGLAEPAKNPLPPVLWGYNDGIPGYSYDPEKAKQLLAEAGYPDGFKTELWAMSNPRPYLPQPLKVAEAIQADLKKVGIEAEIKTFEWATYLDKVKNGEHPMALFGWTGVLADPDNFLYPNLSKTNTKKPANNIAFYKSDELTGLLEKARVTIDQKERIELYQKAQEIVFRDAPWVLLAHTAPPLAKAKYVKGFVAHPMNDSFTEVYLEK
ncbi:ABC transporter substrate-binding protein [Caldibacillus debilis]|uniref:ABC transporter substrate-binding protein n=1 Tax=Caldibacillus debilis TaxID=301148 RepID=UPI000E366D47|nr:ABC transporter substrate-binding protein [Caldibacillus debilis]REJ26206.1 MAG: ABC transporter substrate-binding protein [Caldibacillus debilis]